MNYEATSTAQNVYIHPGDSESPDADHGPGSSSRVQEGLLYAQLSRARQIRLIG